MQSFIKNYMELEKNYTIMTDISRCDSVITVSESSYPRMECDACLHQIFERDDEKNIKHIAIALKVSETFKCRMHFLGCLGGIISRLTT